MLPFPINAILDWPIATEAAFAALLNNKVNAQFKKILNTWAQFLDSPESRYVLGKDPKHGWFGRDALKAMPGFESKFICQPDQPYYGFASWDDFFTRQIRPSQLPIAAVGDDSMIVNACEPAPFKLAHDVKRIDNFWIKGQPYSLRHMFADDPVSKQFFGGTIRQAFLSALSYHRWHSPVSGTIAKVTLVVAPTTPSFPRQAGLLGAQRLAEIYHRGGRPGDCPHRGGLPHDLPHVLHLGRDGRGLDERHHGEGRPARH